MIKVSVCVPTYNNPQEVESLLESLYKQTYKNFEVNISDDSSNELVSQLIKKYQDIYGNAATEPKRMGALRYIHNKKPLGHIFNWNAAIKMATGEYIKIMFSDDWFTSDDSLEAFVKMLDDNPQADLAFSGSMQVLLDGQDISKVKHLEAFKNAYARCAEDEFIEKLKCNYKLFFLGNQIGAPSAGIYRRKGQPALFDEKSNWASDMFLYFDLLCQNPNFAYTTKPLISIGMHENQYTESFSEKDMRIYNDYRYLYTKYKLQYCKECREYFAEKFIIKYHTGLKEAKALGIETTMYWNKWIKEKKDTVCCFIKNRLSICVKNVRRNGD